MVEALIVDGHQLSQRRLFVEVVRQCPTVQPFFMSLPKKAHSA